MKLVTTIAGVREAVAAAARPIGLVPTMGALHEGHLSLIRAARESCDTVVVSIFVNPLQFGPTEDLDRYPRPEGRDIESAEREKVDIVFLPTVEEMYPPGRSTTVHVSGLSDVFEGSVRPGHFDGVATVVAKLFGIVTPDRAFFGQKDAQQLAVVRRMVADLSIPVEVVVCPTVRDEDGLALSSRNVYLTAGRRAAATALYSALEAGAAALEAGRTTPEAEEAMRSVLHTEPELLVDYIAVVDPDTFGPPSRRHLLIVAARVGGTRLIDNLLMGQNV